MPRGGFLKIRGGRSPTTLLIRSLDSNPNNDALGHVVRSFEAYSNASNRTEGYSLIQFGYIDVTADFHKEAISLLERVPKTTSTSEFVQAMQEQRQYRPLYGHCLLHLLILDYIGFRPTFFA